MKNLLHVLLLAFTVTVASVFSAMAAATTSPLTQPIFPAIGTLVSQFPTAVTVLQPVPSNLRYETPIDLGTLGTQSNAYSYAISINSSEQIVGFTSTPPVTCGSSQCVYSQPFIWDSTNGMKLVVSPPNNQGSYLLGINRAGLAAGYAQMPTSVGIPPSIAFTYYNGAVTTLPHLSVQAVSIANALNNAGKVVGLSATTTGIGHAVAWINGAITDLGTLPGYSGGSAEGINDNGIVVGAATWPSSPVIGNSNTKAAWWDNNNVAHPLDNHNPPSSSFAHGINNSGVVVGTLDVFSSVTGNSYTIPVRWVNGQAERLNGNTQGLASHINEKGQIVGQFNYNNGAFLWDNGTFYDLSTLIPPGSGWVLTGAYSINDRGEIVGVGHHNGSLHAFLLKPKP